MDKYYEILGLDKNASESEVKKAYREKIKKHHPDVGGKKSEFTKIIDAKNNILNNLQSESESNSWYDNIKEKYLS